MDKETIFSEALQIETPAERKRFLDEACGNDRTLRAEVEALLAADSDAGSFLNRPPEAFAATGDSADSIARFDDDSWQDLLTESDSPDSLGMLGPYEVVELVGRGGFGVVLRARDPKLNRTVAIKLLAPELAANPMAVRRFLREAVAAAAVAHDHVVTIHAIHEDAKPPFIVMEFIDGQSLQQKIDREGALDIKSILRIGMQTAAGLAAAHRQGLVHRDIKPANILLENGVERVKLTDFGLARAVDDVAITRTGTITGTPQYMSPEQAQGERVDARTDLFSLGCVLYALCTGRAAFRADSAVAVMHRVVHDEAKPIEKVNAEIPDWLCEIVAKLLAKSAADRFESAEELEALLGRHLAHLQQPESVPRPERIEIATRVEARQAPKRKGVRLGRVLLWLCAILALGLLLSEGFRYSHIAASISDYMNDRGRIVVRLPEQIGSNVNVEFDGGLVEGKQTMELIVAPGQYRSIVWAGDRQLDNRIVRVKTGGWSEVLLDHKATNAEFFPIQSGKHGTTVLHLGDSATEVIANQGKPIKRGSRNVLIQSEPGDFELVVIDGTSSDTVHPLTTWNGSYKEFTIEGHALQVVFQRRNETTDSHAAGGADMTTSSFFAAAKQFALDPGKHSDVWRLFAPIAVGETSGATGMNSDGTTFVNERITMGISGTSNAIRETLLEMEDYLAEIAKENGASFPKVTSQVGGNREILVVDIVYESASAKGTIRLSLRGFEDRDLHGLGNENCTIEFEIREAELLKSAADKPFASVVDAWRTDGNREPVTCLDVAANGKYLVSGHTSASEANGGKIWLWKVDASLQVDGHERHGVDLPDGVNVTDIAISPDSQFFAWTQSDGKLGRLRTDLATDAVDNLAKVEDELHCLAWKPDGTQIVAGGDGKIIFYDTAKGGKPIQVLKAHGGKPVTNIAWSPADDEITTTADGAVWRWDLTNDPPTHYQDVHTGNSPDERINSLDYSPNGERLTWSYADGNVAIRIPGELSHNGPHDYTSSAATYSPDGRWVAFSVTYLDQPEPRNHIFFRPDHDSPTWHEDQGWGHRLFVNETGDSPTTSLDFTNDGKYLVSGHDDGTIRWWEFAEVANE